MEQYKICYLGDSTETITSTRSGAGLCGAVHGVTVRAYPAVDSSGVAQNGDGKE